MFQTESNHCQLVAEALAGIRQPDEQTVNSLAVLGERLERVKQLGGPFAQIEFSPHVEQLLRATPSLVVG